MQILSIFLKLQAVKQSGPGFLAYPVVLAEDYFKRNVSYIVVVKLRKNPQKFGNVKLK